ncbi:MAG: murein L,D-transpeptidase YafK [Celeribacter sp.]|jgi:murein L,D-transpeptidase YafK
MLAYTQQKTGMDRSMNRRFIITGLAALSLFPTTAFARTLKPYSGPQVTRVVLYKGKRRLYLLSGTKVLKKYKVGLGGVPVGHKQFEGDGKTPEGSYIIDRRNAESKYHLSVGISYPNSRDVAYARQFGRSPGGEIFIHGRAGAHRGFGRDWTAGCIAVKDKHIEEIYMMVLTGTQIDIHP